MWSVGSGGSPITSSATVPCRRSSWKSTSDIARQRGENGPTAIARRTILPRWRGSRTSACRSTGVSWNIEALKATKVALPEEDYLEQLEALLLELARKNEILAGVEAR